MAWSLMQDLQAELAGSAASAAVKEQNMPAKDPAHRLNGLHSKLHSAVMLESISIEVDTVVLQ